MFSKMKITIVGVLMLAFGVFGGAAMAQDTTTTPNQDKVEKSDKFQRRGGFARRGGEGFRRGLHGGRGLAMLRGIQLTDAQKAQIKSILDSNKPDQSSLDQMKSLRETRKNGIQLTDDQKAQLKSARQAQAAKMKSVHEQIMNVLTAEQKQQLEQRHQEMQKRRQDRKELRRTDKPSVDKTVSKPIDG